MNVFKRIALPVLAGSYELHRVGGVGGQRNAAGLVLSPHRDMEFLHGVKARINQHRLVTKSAGSTSHQAERIGGPQGKSPQHVLAPA